MRTVETFPDIAKTVEEKIQYLLDEANRHNEQTIAKIESIVFYVWPGEPIHCLLADYYANFSK